MEEKLTTSLTIKSGKHISKIILSTGEFWYLCFYQLGKVWGLLHTSHQGS
jgi:hypothetical protein